MESLLELLPYPKLTIAVIIYFVFDYAYLRDSDSNEKIHPQVNHSEHNSSNNRNTDSLEDNDDYEIETRYDEFLEDPIFHEFESNQYHDTFNESFSDDISDIDFDSCFDSDY